MKVRASDRVMFLTEARPIDDDGHLRMHVGAVCSYCDEDSWIPVSTSAAPPPEMVAKLFRKRGWKIGSTRKKDACPVCYGLGKALSSPEGTERAVLREQFEKTVVGEEMDAEVLSTPVEEVPAKEEKVVNEKPMPDLKVVPPRDPTREEKRKVLDALDGAYDVEKQCYRGELTDIALAEQLKVPRAWVTDLREELFGPEVNEEDSLLEKEIADVKRKISDAETQALEALAKLESILREAKARLARIEDKQSARKRK